MMYPVGASWKAVNSEGSTGRVWLERENPPFWRWEFYYNDGSGYRSDWTPSKRLAIEECRTRMARPMFLQNLLGPGEKIRFKREK
jgi:hypothetical protein